MHMYMYMFSTHAMDYTVHCVIHSTASPGTAAACCLLLAVLLCYMPHANKATATRLLHVLLI
jgi:hypothetical protein